MWLVAMEDLMREAASPMAYDAVRDADNEGLVLPGIRYARNATVHGERVVATIFVSPGAMLGAMTLGSAPLASGPFTGWVARAQIPYEPRGKSKQALQQVRSYDHQLAGHSVHEPLERALGFLKGAVALDE
jgi:hypothetical protein